MIVSSIRETERVANHSLTSLINVFSNKCLQQNIDITSFLNLHCKQKRNKTKPLVVLGECAITQLNNTTFLGSIIDHHLTWDKYVANLKMKLLFQDCLL